MKIGAFASFMTPVSTPEVIAETGRRAEEAGLDSLWMGEHVALFDEMEFPYPGSRDGKLPVPAGAGLPDTTTTFAFLASVTKTLRFGTGIALVPQRNPIYTAKEFATLDWLTGGRVDFGIGVGWCKEEVLACGYSFEDRGERCDEFLDAMIKLWTEPAATYHGKHITLDACRMDPKPVQKPHIPIIGGGYSPPALRRAVKYGSGWLGFGAGPEHTQPAIAAVEAALANAGRNRNDFEIIVAPAMVSPDVVKGFQDLGVDRLVPIMPPEDAGSAARRIGELEKLVALV